MIKTSSFRCSDKSNITVHSIGFVWFNDTIFVR